MFPHNVTCDGGNGGKAFIGNFHRFLMTRRGFAVEKKGKRDTNSRKLFTNETKNSLNLKRLFVKF